MITNVYTDGAFSVKIRFLLCKQRLNESAGKLISTVGGRMARPLNKSRHKSFLKLVFFRRLMDFFWKTFQPQTFRARKNSCTFDREKNFRISRRSSTQEVIAFSLLDFYWFSDSRLLLLLTSREKETKGTLVDGNAVTVTSESPKEIPVDVNRFSPSLRSPF